MNKNDLIAEVRLNPLWGCEGLCGGLGSVSTNLPEGLFYFLWS